MSFLLLSALLLCTAAMVWPYMLNPYNTEWLPSFIRPDRDYLDTRYTYYYPADESRKALCLALVFAAFAFPTASLFYKRTEASAYLFHLFPFLPSAYLLHRTFCFHKQNRHTPDYVDNSLKSMVYEPWKAVVLWLLSFLLPLLAATGYLSLAVCQALSLSFALLVLALLLWEYKQEYMCLKKTFAAKDPNPTFMEMMPYSHFLILYVVSVLLVQTALTLHSVHLLILYAVLQMSATVLEFRWRFNNLYLKDMLENWGFDHTHLLLTTREELEYLKEKGYSAIQKKNLPCWTLLVEMPKSHKYKVEIASDLEVKSEELYLRNKSVHYARKFNNVREASHYARWCNEHPEEQERLVQDLNPQKVDMFRDSQFYQNLFKL